MIQLRDKVTGSLLGSISEEDLQFLIDNLEEEWEEDTDYFINRTTLEMLVNLGAPQHLTDLIEQAMGDGDDIEIEWSRT
jgi:hypothetical protein